MKKNSLFQRVKQNIETSARIQVTAKDVEFIIGSVLGEEIKNRKQISNLIGALRDAKFLKPTSLQEGRLRVYEVVPVAKEKAQQRSNASRKQSGRLKTDELEDQLIKNAQSLLEARRRIKELEEGFEVDFHRLGKAVFMTHQKLIEKYNRSDADLRDERLRSKKLHSEDRAMIGGLQKRVRNLEATIQTLRKNRARSSDKPDMDLFNQPRILKRSAT